MPSTRRMIGIEMGWLLPPRARILQARGTSPYIGLPQRFCEAKDLWEESEGGKEVTNALTRKRGDDETPTITPSVTTPKKTSDVVTAPRGGAYNKESPKLRKRLLAPYTGEAKSRSWLNNPSVLPLARHLPLHRGGYIEANSYIYNMDKKGAGVGCFLRRGVIE